MNGIDLLDRDGRHENQHWRNYLSTDNSTAVLAPDLAAFAKLKIPASLLAYAGVRHVTDAEARTDFGIKGSPSMDMAGVIFPYFNPITGRRTTCRLRRDHPEVDAETGKPKNKYLAPFGDGRHLYFPPGASEKLKDPDTIIVLVEAEKSSLALTASAQRTSTNILALGLGGCWGWRGRVGKAESTDGSRVDVVGPLPDLYVCNGRKVYVCLDANVTGNPKVRQAEKALVTFLAEHNCDVHIRHLPHLDDVNGPDDLIALHGDDAMRMALMTPICPSDGPGILEAALEAIAGEIYTSNMERFYAFCAALQRLRGPLPVALPVERIGNLLGCHWSTVAMYRRQAVVAGWLQHAGKAVPHVRAATFSVKLPILTKGVEEILTNSEGTLTKSKTIHMGMVSSSLPTSSENLPSSHSEKTSEFLSEKTMTSLSENALTTSPAEKVEIPTIPTAQTNNSDGVDNTAETKEELWF